MTTKCMQIAHTKISDKFAEKWLLEQQQEKVFMDYPEFPRTFHISAKFSLLSELSLTADEMEKNE